MEQLMFILKEHYSLSSSHTNDVRPYILLIAKQFVARVGLENWSLGYNTVATYLWVQGKGIQAGELEAFLSYLLSVPEVRQIKLLRLNITGCYCHRKRIWWMCCNCYLLWCSRTLIILL